MTLQRFVVVLLLALCAVLPLRGDEPVFSGPQVGEKLAPFTVRGVFDDDAGKDLDFVTQAAGKPIVLIFVHDVNRPSVAMTRILSAYTVSRKQDGLATGIVWLDDDLTEAENTLKRIRHALTPQAPTGISLDGREGPGSYGLNRNITLTILVGHQGIVTANFALVQPSLQVDLPKILQAIVAVAGGTAPALDELPGMAEMMRNRSSSEPDANLRSLIRPVIRADATAEEVDQAARAVEQYLETHAESRAQVGQIAKRIVDSGKLSNYGTQRAQEHLRKWAQAYGEKPGDDSPSGNDHGGRK